MTGSNKKNQESRPTYEPPTLFDLGGGVAYAKGECKNGGVPKGLVCKTGGSPGGSECVTGFSASGGECKEGNSAGTKCKDGYAAFGGECKTGNTAMQGKCKKGALPR